NNQRRGDIIVFILKNRTLVKRIARSIYDQNRLSFYVLGDNPEASRDSRNFGNIKQSQILGEAKILLFSVDASLNLNRQRVIQPLNR
ncbi:MAG: S26 family signal peptidase, partial [Reinekea sp.]